MHSITEQTQPVKTIRGYTRAAVIPLEVVFPLIKDQSVIKTVLNGYTVNTKSLRLTNFAHSHTCSCCGLVATHFAIESNSGATPSWHLNMWHSDGVNEEILFTHDHTIARSLGGDHSADNTTTMCTVCNAKKSEEEAKAFALLSVEEQKLYRKNRRTQKQQWKREYAIKLEQQMRQAEVCA